MFPKDSPLAAQVIPAKNYHARRTVRPRVIVIHDQETPETPKRAVWCAQYFGGVLGPAPIASAHYMTDAAEVVQGVPEAGVAFAAPGCNADGIQIELTGYAAQKRAEWLDAYSSAQLKLVARLVVDIARRHTIPLVHLSNAQLAAGQPGLVSHAQVSQVYKRSDHSDPGANFPWDVLMHNITATSAPAPATPAAPAAINTRAAVLKQGDTGAQVKALQAGMLRVFPSYAAPIAASGGADGVFGSGTKAVVQEFQRRSGLVADGIVGQLTRAALAKNGVKL